MEKKLAAQAVYNTVLEERAISFPLENFSGERMRECIEVFMREADFPATRLNEITRGAFLARDPRMYKLNISLNHHEVTRRPEDLVTAEGVVCVSSTEKWILDREKDVTMAKMFAAAFSSAAQSFSRLFRPRSSSESNIPRSVEKPWQVYPSTIYGLVLSCSIGAIVQGFEEAMIDGAQISLQAAFPDTFGDGSGSILLRGFFNGAPYVTSAIACLHIFICWLNHVPFFINGRLGRRGVISAASLLSFFSCMAQGYAAKNFYRVLVARLFLGLGIGPKSAIVTIYVSECAPAQLRGAADTMWQMWTSFGLMGGFVMSAIWWNELEAWRYMLASPLLTPLVPMMAIWMFPESPRFLLQCAKDCRDTDPKRRAEFIRKAGMSLQQLNKTQLQADRELFSLYSSINMEPEQSWLEIIANPLKKGRTRRALMASAWIMLLQQLCGFNVLANYSATIIGQIRNQDVVDMTPVEITAGLGIGHFIFGVAAFFLMDTYGRRSLLLTAFPILGACQAAIAAGVWHTPDTTETVHLPTSADSRDGLKMSLVFMFIFFIIYAFSIGPVAPTYASESMPLQHRDQGMGYAMFINWTFNFLMVFLWPLMSTAFSPRGGFLFYSGTCFLGFFITLCFVRETKKRELESMGEVFSIGTWDFICEFAWSQVKFWIRFVLRRTTRLSKRPDFNQYLETKQQKEKEIVRDYKLKYRTFNESNNERPGSKV